MQNKSNAWLASQGFQAPSDGKKTSSSIDPTLEIPHKLTSKESKEPGTFLKKLPLVLISLNNDKEDSRRAAKKIFSDNDKVDLEHIKTISKIHSMRAVAIIKSLKEKDNKLLIQDVSNKDHHAEINLLSQLAKMDSIKSIGETKVIIHMKKSPCKLCCGLIKDRQYESMRYCCNPLTTKLLGAGISGLVLFRFSYEEIYLEGSEAANRNYMWKDPDEACKAYKSIAQQENITNHFTKARFQIIIGPSSKATSQLRSWCVSDLNFGCV